MQRKWESLFSYNSSKKMEKSTLESLHFINLLSFFRHTSIMNIQFFLPAYLTGHSTTIEDVSTLIVVDTHGSWVWSTSIPYKIKVNVCLGAIV